MLIGHTQYSMYVQLSTLYIWVNGYLATSAIEDVDARKKTL